MAMRLERSIFCLQRETVQRYFIHSFIHSEKTKKKIDSKLSIKKKREPNKEALLSAIAELKQVQLVLRQLPDFESNEETELVESNL